MIIKWKENSILISKGSANPKKGEKNKCKKKVNWNGTE